MPKELARVMSQYGTLQNKAIPVVKELTDHGRDYFLMRENVRVVMQELAQQLRELGVTSAAAPAAAANHGVQGSVEQIEKYSALMDDRGDLFQAAARKLAPIRSDVVTLQRDVAAVIRSKSGIFSTSKSLPQLKALSTALENFAAGLAGAADLAAHVS